MPKNKWIVPNTVPPLRPRLRFHPRKQQQSWGQPSQLLSERGTILMMFVIILIGAIACGLSYILANWL